MPLVDCIIQPNVINFAPESEAEEIIQNVITICSTLKGTVPLDRDFGVDTGLLDLPVNTARAKVSAQFIDAIRRFEPRADVVKVSFNDNGFKEAVLPVVSIRLQ